MIEIKDGKAVLAAGEGRPHVRRFWVSLFESMDPAHPGWKTLAEVDARISHAVDVAIRQVIADLCTRTSEMLVRENVAEGLAQGARAEKILERIAKEVIAPTIGH